MNAQVVDPVEAFLAKVVAVQVVPANSVLVIHCRDGMTVAQGHEMRAAWARVAPDVRVVFVMGVDAITVAVADEAA